MMSSLTDVLRIFIFDLYEDGLHGVGKVSQFGHMENPESLYLIFDEHFDTIDDFFKCT